jgi:hypothetical protein
MSTGPDSFAPTKALIKDGASLSPQPLDGQPMIDPKKSKYAAPHKKKVKPVKNYKSAEKYAPNKDKPTTADAIKGLLNLPAAMAAVDPKGISSIAPMMYKMLGQIASAAGGSSESSRKQTVEDSLSGALSILANKYTFNQIVLVFDNALKDNAIDLIDEGYQSVVKNALANLYLNYFNYGDGNFPTTEVPKVVYIGPARTPLVEKNLVPDLYVQEYYTPENDPYPGYIKWISQDEKDYVFTERSIGDPYYSTADEEVYTEAEQSLALDLDPYISDNNLTATILNELLRKEENNIESSTAEKTGGKNSSGNAMSTLMKLAGYAGQIANLQQSLQLPISVLNQGAIKKSHESFMKNIGQLKQAKDKARQAAKPLQAATKLAASLGGVGGAIGGVAGAVGSVAGAVGSVTSAVGTVSNVVGSVSSVSGAVSSVQNLSSSAQNLYKNITS